MKKDPLEELLDNPTWTGIRNTLGGFALFAIYAVVIALIGTALGKLAAML